MGSRMVARLLEAGFEVTVWNRTPSRTDDVCKMGARYAETPREAASEADIVFSMVRDDAASRIVWLDEGEGAMWAMRKETIGIECSTLSLPFVRELHGKFLAHGSELLDAPVAGSRPQAEAGQLIFLVGGNREPKGAVAAVLSSMGGKIHYSGGPGSGCVVKLMVNSLFGIQLAALAELLGFCDRAGIDVTRAAEVLGETPVSSPAVRAAAASMISQDFAPAFPIEMVKKDFELLAATADECEAVTPVTGCVGEIYSDAVMRKFGTDNITGVVQLYVESNRGRVLR